MIYGERKGLHGIQKYITAVLLTLLKSGITEVHGVENVSASNCLLVGYHSRPTLDVVYLQSQLRPTTIITELLFAIPFMAGILTKNNFISAEHGNSTNSSFIRNVVNGTRPVLLLPGGAYECMKSYDNQYKVDWKDDPGFARLLLNDPDRIGKDTKVVPFFTSNCEDIYFSTPHWYTYSGNKVKEYFTALRNKQYYVMPLLLVLCFLSLGLVFFPNPVKLDAYIGE